MPLIPSLSTKEAEKGCPYDFNTSLVYILSTRPVRDTKRENTPPISKRKKKRTGSMSPWVWEFAVPLKLWVTNLSEKMEHTCLLTLDRAPTPDQSKDTTKV